MRNFTRRDFLKLCGTSSIGLALAACGVTPTPTATPAPTNTPLPTSTPLPTATTILTNTPAPTSTATATATATPRPPTLRSVGEQLRVYLGTTVDGAEGYQDPRYISAAREHFSVLFNSAIQQSTIDRWGLEMVRVFRRRATADNQIFNIHPAFWHQDVSALLKNASDDEVKRYMENRIRTILGFVERVDTGAKPTYINFYNEALLYGQGKPGWHASPYYRVFGDRVITEAYLLFYRIAQTLNLQVGKDFRLLYSDYDIFRPGGKTDAVFDTLVRSKIDIANALDTSQDKIQLDIAIQYHLDISNPPKFNGYFPVPTDDEMLTNFRRFAQIGRIHITEFDVADAQSQAEITAILRRVTRTAITSGLVDSINYWNSLRVYETDYDKTKRESGGEIFYHPIGLFDRNYTPTDAYRALLQDLIELSAKK